MKFFSILCIINLIYLYTKGGQSLTAIIILILLFLAYKVITSQRVHRFLFGIAHRTTMNSHQAQSEVRQVQRQRITPQVNQQIDQTLKQFANGMWIPHWLPGVLSKNTEQQGVLPDFAAQTVQQHITALGLVVDSSYQRYALPASLPQALQRDGMRLCLADAAALGVNQQDMESFYLRSNPHALPEEARAAVREAKRTA